MIYERIGLSEKQFNQIIQCFKRFPQIERAVVFGSRAKGNYKQSSDVDIAFWGDFSKISAKGRIESELEELPIIYTFDCLEYESLKNEALKEHIDRVGVEIYKKGDMNERTI